MESGELSRGTIEDYDASFECERTIISDCKWACWQHMDFLVRRDPSFHPLLCPLCVEMLSHCVFIFSPPHYHYHRLHSGNATILAVIQTALFSISWFHNGGEITSGRPTFISEQQRKIFKVLLLRGLDHILHQRGCCCLLWRDEWFAKKPLQLFWITSKTDDHMNNAFRMLYECYILSQHRGPLHTLSLAPNQTETKDESKIFANLQTSSLETNRSCWSWCNIFTKSLS